ncbi:hypothetical protein LCGC14_1390020 [marine sediment metagenome]|uniref:Uncharacterized protein n=1 Tax=marine sediment metagenome TaxID=412755 RepID=A0A0F9KL15_9ZZZZ
MKIRINKFLTLRLEKGETNIYITGKIFQQCKCLLLDVSLENNFNLRNINSIDEAAEKLDHGL